MGINEAIFIFTKDRPDVLKKTLDSIADLSIRKYVMDDSFQEMNQIHNKELTAIFCDVLYNGKHEYDYFVKSKNIIVEKYRFILRQIGNSEWNLGYSRNFALLFSKAIGIDKALFIDDDITVHNINLVSSSFKLLEKYDFVGANITGIDDDSIIGHIQMNWVLLIMMRERYQEGFYLSILKT
jgi:hypothetical protein